MIELTCKKCGHKQKIRSKNKIWTCSHCAKSYAKEECPEAQRKERIEEKRKKKEKKWEEYCKANDELTEEMEKENCMG